MRFGLGIAFEALADCLAQMIERGFGQRWQRGPIVALAACGSPPAVHPFAERAQARQHHVDQVAIGLEIRAAFVGDGVELFDPSAEAVT